jgi:hypothetical protein
VIEAGPKFFTIKSGNSLETVSVNSSVVDPDPDPDPLRSKTFCRISGQPDIRLIQKPDTGYLAGYPVRAGYRISGRIFVLTTIFLVKLKIKFF